MILTPIPPKQLASILDRCVAGLSDRRARDEFSRIRATSPDRAAGADAEQHRMAALAFARGFGMPIYPEGTPCRFNWDGTALSAATEAYVILHEVAHFVLAPPERRGLVEFGLGPGPDTLDREAAERAAVLHLLLAGTAARTVRATLLAFFALSYGVTLASHAVTIGIPAPTWLAAGILLPFAFLGGLAGRPIGDRLGADAFAMLAIALLAVAGAYTLGVAAVAFAT